MSGLFFSYLLPSDPIPKLTVSDSSSGALRLAFFFSETGISELSSFLDALHQTAKVKRYSDKVRA